MKTSKNMLVLCSSHLDYHDDDTFKSDFDKHYDTICGRLTKYYGKQIEFCSITTINKDTTKNLSKTIPKNAKNLFQIVGNFPEDLEALPEIDVNGKRLLCKRCNMFSSTTRI